MKLKELLPIIPLRQDFLKMFLLSVAADGATVYSPRVKRTTETPDVLLQDLIQTPDSNRAVDFHDQEYLIASWRYRYCGNDLDTTDNFPSFRDWTFNPTEDSNQCEGILYHANRTGVERPFNEPITNMTDLKAPLSPACGLTTLH